MKKIYTTLVAVLAICQISYGQNTFPTTGNVGIGTTTPLSSTALQIVRSGVDAGANYPSAQITTSGSGNIYGPIFYLNGTSGTGGRMWGIVSSGALDAAATGAAGNFSIWDATAATSRVTINSTGMVGLSTTTPQARLHIFDGGTSINAINQYTGNLIIQGNSGGRSSTLGASLEFVVPANTDGSNPWGQARIITVAGNASTTNATGMLVLGTRRMFDKGVGTGMTWNYGDDLVIDGSGNIGVNTKNTYGYKLAVNGNAIATSMTVKLYANWPDYVFKKDYTLPSLSEVKTYIDQNQHLPEMPSEAEVAKDGINLGEMVKLQTKKIEELTLYLIDKDKQDKEKDAKLQLQQKQIEDQQKINQSLQQQIDKLAKKLNH